VAASSTPGISPVSLHICPCTHSPSAQSSPPSETGQQQLDLSSVIRKQQLCHHPSGSSLVLPPGRRSPTRCLRMGITSCHMFDKASPLSTTPLGAHLQHEQGLCLAEVSHCSEGANSQRPTTQELAKGAIKAHIYKHSLPKQNSQLQSMSNKKKYNC